MGLGRAWGRQLLGASGAAVLAPGATLAAVLVLALAGGFGQLGTLGQAFAGPSLPAVPQPAGLPGAGSQHSASPVLIALRTGPAGSQAATATATAIGGTAAGGSRRTSLPGAGGARHRVGPPAGGSGSPGRGPGGGGRPAHGGSPPSQAPPSASAHKPTLVDSVVSIGSSVTKQLPSPVGSLAAQTLQSVGHTVDGVLAPNTTDRTLTGVHAVLSGSAAP